MAVFLYVCGCIVLAGAVVLFKRTTGRTPALIAFIGGGVAIAVMVVTGIVMYISGHNEDRNAISSYMRTEGYRVVNMHYKSKKGWHNSYWEVEVQRTADPACGGTMHVTRYSDYITITQGLSC